MLRTKYRHLSCTSLKRSANASVVPSHSSWAALSRLRNGSVEAFRKEAFSPSVPQMLPKGHFQDFPAVSRWFLTSKNDPTVVALQHEYLDEFGNTVVAQEYSYFPEAPREAATVGSLFTRQELPLSNFLLWVKDSGSHEKFRVYLAQTSVSALPSKMRDDLPIPDLVTKSGRGDVYDASIWIGIPPTYTPLHYDPNPNLLVQLAGCKTVRLLPPNTGNEVFMNVQESLGKMGSANFRGDEMMMGEEGQLFYDLIWNDKSHSDRFSSFGFEAQLAQGDGLFIPKGWWHSVKGLGRGITASVSFCSFQTEALNVEIPFTR